MHVVHEVAESDAHDVAAAVELGHISDGRDLAQQFQIIEAALLRIRGTRLRQPHPAVAPQPAGPPK